MLDLELLEQLVAFNKYKTISETANHLMITQPSVSRNLKKLEDELGVKLFNRSVNRISLTPTGELAVKEAETVLKACTDYLKKVKNFDQQQNELTISSVIPGPIMWIKHDHAHFVYSSTFNFHDELIKPNKVTEELNSYHSQIVITTEEMNNDQIESFYLGTEKLLVRIDPFNPLANQKAVSFDDLAGLSFLVYQEIGPWRKLSEKYIPNAKFLYQQDIDALEELTHYSNFPVFRSNLSISSHLDNDNRIPIPIVDPHNKIDFYATYLRVHSKSLRPLLNQFAQAFKKIKL